MVMSDRRAYRYHSHELPCFVDCGQKLLDHRMWPSQHSRAVARFRKGTDVSLCQDRVPLKWVVSL